MTQMFQNAITMNSEINFKFRIDLEAQDMFEGATGMNAPIIWNNIENDEEINILKKVANGDGIDIFNGSLDDIATNLFNAFTELGWNFLFIFIDRDYIYEFLKTERETKSMRNLNNKKRAFVGGRKKTKKKRKGYSMKINKKRKKRRSKKRKNSRSNFKGR